MQHVQAHAPHLEHPGDHTADAACRAILHRMKNPLLRSNTEATFFQNMPDPVDDDTALFVIRAAYAAVQSTDPACTGNALALQVEKLLQHPDWIVSVMQNIDGHHQATWKALHQDFKALSPAHARERREQGQRLLNVIQSCSPHREAIDMTAGRWLDTMRLANRRMLHLFEDTFQSDIPMSEPLTAAQEAKAIDEHITSFLQPRQQREAAWQQGWNAYIARFRSHILILQDRLQYDPHRIEQICAELRQLPAAREQETKAAPSCKQQARALREAYEQAARTRHSIITQAAQHALEWSLMACQKKHGSLLLTIEKAALLAAHEAILPSGPSSTIGLAILLDPSSALFQRRTQAACSAAWQQYQQPWSHCLEAFEAHQALSTLYCQAQQQNDKRAAAIARLRHAVQQLKDDPAPPCDSKNHPDTHRLSMGTAHDALAVTALTERTTSTHTPTVAPVAAVTAHTSTASPSQGTIRPPARLQPHHVPASANWLQLSGLAVLGGVICSAISLLLTHTLTTDFSPFMGYPHLILSGVLSSALLAYHAWRGRSQHDKQQSDRALRCFRPLTTAIVITVFTYFLTQAGLPCLLHDAMLQFPGIAAAVSTAGTLIPFGVAGFGLRTTHAKQKSHS